MILFYIGLVLAAICSALLIIDNVRETTKKQKAEEELNHKVVILENKVEALVSIVLNKQEDISNEEVEALINDCKEGFGLNDNKENK